MKPRIKMGQMPGDASKQTKASMMEGRHPDKKRSKAFKKEVRMKERAVLKRRSNDEVVDEMRRRELEEDFPEYYEK